MKRATRYAAVGICLCSGASAGVIGCGSDNKSGGLGEGVGNETMVAEVVGNETEVVASEVAEVAEQETAVVETVEPVDTYVPQPGEFGYHCESNDECNSGWCVQTADGRQCTRTCSSECPDGYACREAPGTDAVFICLPRFLHLCEPCRETIECNEAGETGNFCISHGADGRFCGVGCLSNTCPDGYECQETEVGGGMTALQCVPKTGECTCSTYAKQLQKPTTCFVENPNGKCEGTRFCIQSGLSSCDAATPFPESCNKLDDNCNGQTDEFPPDYVCQIKNEFGSCPGKGTCIDGQETCDGRAPAPETCNGIDDDCNGQTDDAICDDGNPCTTDTCSGDGQCNHTPDNTKLCDDGSVCTQLDKCQDGVCKGFNPLPCGTGNACLDWQCDPTVGCLSSFNAAACEDGNPCTVNDKCSQGVCVSGGPNACDDHNECTQDTCTPGVGCTHNPLQNGTGCQLANLTQCKTGQCQNGSCVPKNMADGSGCQTGSSECPTGYCSGGNCNYKDGASCSYDSGMCEGSAPGKCTAVGNCEPTTDPRCHCNPNTCLGINFCCTINIGIEIDVGICFDSGGVSLCN